MLIPVGEDELLLSGAGEAARQRSESWCGGEPDDLAEDVHVWHVFAPLMPEAKQAIDSIGVFIRERIRPARAPG